MNWHVCTTMFWFPIGINTNRIAYIARDFSLSFSLANIECYAALAAPEEKFRKRSCTQTKIFSFVPIWWWWCNYVYIVWYWSSLSCLLVESPVYFCFRADHELVSTSIAIDRDWFWFFRYGEITESGDKQNIGKFMYLTFSCVYSDCCVWTRNIYIKKRKEKLIDRERKMKKTFLPSPSYIQHIIFVNKKIKSFLVAYLIVK